MAYGANLVTRIREALAEEPAVREVQMFGGLSFMVNEKVSVGTMRNGDLLVRCDPAVADDLIEARGADQAHMGPGRPMSKGWIAIPPDRLASREDLGFWISVALDYNGKGRAD